MTNCRSRNVLHNVLHVQHKCNAMHGIVRDGLLRLFSPPFPTVSFRTHLCLCGHYSVRAVCMASRCLALLFASQLYSLVLCLHGSPVHAFFQTLPAAWHASLQRHVHTASLWQRNNLTESRRLPCISPTTCHIIAPAGRYPKARHSVNRSTEQASSASRTWQRCNILHGTRITCK